ncbi:MAG: single-stranded-DNA-specific exonuclease RecJ [Defluviitaleaceae bacterium]|nr:single-stranded-DNA-specific exonuclease RecJ [Defluviitaleaceae bacterium]MCL2239992.1 single-stranded-DNA-specific exonuclease RecJ [Defluviitaleaceae bacterium]
MKINWVVKETDADLLLMSQVLGVSEITANMLANRGLRTKKKAQAFLRPGGAPFHDTLGMKDAEKALARMAQALAMGEKIVIYGDYDVDGVMATVIMYRVLTRLGGDVYYYMPHRVEEGYGLNTAAVQQLAEEETRLLVAVDNGISAVAEIELANALGMEVVIIDHHEPGEVLPPAIAIVDPKQPECTYPFKELCAAGLAYKLAGALCQKINTPYIEEREMCALAAMACICDIVSLQEENRTMVHRGLGALNADKLINPGLGELITQRGYIDKTIDAYCIGFVLGPCLNATGRLDSAELSVELLLSQDIDNRISLAQELIALNTERKDLTAQCVERALEGIPPDTALPKILVLTDPHAHESVAGIVAGRVRDTTHRPTLLLTPAKDNPDEATPSNPTWKGSGRSIPAYNLFEALYAHRHLFHRFGGHAAAAGLTLAEENIPRLREALNRDCPLTEGDFLPTLEIDRVLAPGEITLELSRELEALAPFGKGNPAPLFATYNLYVENIRPIDAKNTLIFTLKGENNSRLKGIAFGLNRQYHEALAALPQGSKPTLDAAYRIETNVYNGMVSVQMAIKDFVLR